MIRLRRPGVVLRWTRIRVRRPRGRRSGRRIRRSRRCARIAAAVVPAGRRRLVRRHRLARRAAETTPGVVARHFTVPHVVVASVGGRGRRDAVVVKWPAVGTFRSVVGAAKGVRKFSARRWRIGCRAARLGCRRDGLVFDSGLLRFEQMAAFRGCPEAGPVRFGRGGNGRRHRRDFRLAVVRHTHARGRGGDARQCGCGFRRGRARCGSGGCAGRPV